MHQLSHEASELVAALNTIAETAKISHDSIVAVPYTSTLDNHPDVKYIRQVPIRYPLPSEFQNGRTHWTTHKVRSIRSDPFNKSAMARHTTGIVEFEIKCEKKTIRFWVFAGTAGNYFPLNLHSAFFVEQKDVFSFLKKLKRREQSISREIEAPILPGEMLLEIYKNSIGFLIQGSEYAEQYRKFNIPLKRGILMCGRPGCGKTLTCKWLKGLCRRFRLSTNVVTVSSYRHAQSCGNVSSLFSLEAGEKGIIFFDDMDIMVQKRGSSTVRSEDLSLFLAQLDGLESKDGVVYIFTTNYVNQLDEAFVRPGRIDLYLPFNTPTDSLRQKFIDKHFPEEIKEAIDVPELLERSADYTFAELEEVRKLLCFDIIEGKTTSLQRCLSTFERHRKDFEERVKMGFNKLEDDDEEDYAELDNLLHSIPGCPQPARRRS